MYWGHPTRLLNGGSSLLHSYSCELIYHTCENKTSTRKINSRKGSQHFIMFLWTIYSIFFLFLLLFELLLSFIIAAYHNRNAKKTLSASTWVWFRPRGLTWHSTASSRCCKCLLPTLACVPGAVVIGFVFLLLLLLLLFIFFIFILLLLL